MSDKGRLKGSNPKAKNQAESEISTDNVGYPVEKTETQKAWKMWKVHQTPLHGVLLWYSPTHIFCCLSHLLLHYLDHVVINISSPNALLLSQNMDMEIVNVNDNIGI
jgi:hypothetical protein